MPSPSVPTLQMAVTEVGRLDLEPLSARALSKSSKKIGVTGTLIGTMQR